MKLREKMKRFCTLDVHNHAGFTLVELIIVIAILAILSTGAIAGYSAYIEKAKAAADMNLLSAYNTAFTSACAINGVPMDAVEGTEILLQGEEGSMTYAGIDIKIDTTKAARSGGDSIEDKIEEAFDIYLGDENKTIAFKVYVNIVFADGSFIGYAEGEYGGIYSDVFTNLGSAITGSITNVQESIFGEIGAEELMNKVTNVTGLANLLANGDPENGTGPSKKFQDFLKGTEGNLVCALGGYTYEEMMAKYAEAGEDAEKIAALDKIMQESTLKYNQLIQANKDKGMTDDEAKYALMTNYAVLLAASKTDTSATAQSLGQQLQSGEITSGMIQNLMKDDDPDTAQAAMADAAMLYGMYTAWANGLEDATKKEAALKNASTIDGFIADMNNTDFVAYLNDSNSSAQKDLEGYMGAMDIINQSGKNGDAVANLLANGYSDPTLLAALEDLLK